MTTKAKKTAAKKVTAKKVAATTTTKKSATKKEVDGFGNGKGSSASAINEVFLKNPKQSFTTAEVVEKSGSTRNRVPSHLNTLRLKGLITRVEDKNGNQKWKMVKGTK